MVLSLLITIFMYQTKISTKRAQLNDLVVLIKITTFTQI